MTIKLPYWAKDIDDDGIATFIAFAKLIADLHGYDTRYYLHIDDIVRMVNKRSKGINDWIVSNKCIKRHMRCSDIFEAAYSFDFKTKPTNNTRSQRTHPYELTEHRAQLVWIYLLGCLNHGLITKKKHKRIQPGDRFKLNTYDIKEFQIDRKALANYIPVRDR